ncbi:MAG TPA: hypothetical protein PKD85_13120 [Saprospiraceae bacterium]|nr:hypothetical protein [Saprospiraceae bacterium]
MKNLSVLSGKLINWSLVFSKNPMSYTIYATYVIYATQLISSTSSINFARILSVLSGKKAVGLSLSRDFTSHGWQEGFKS